MSEVPIERVKITVETTDATGRHSIIVFHHLRPTQPGDIDIAVRPVEPPEITFGPLNRPARPERQALHMRVNGVELIPDGDTGVTHQMWSSDG